MSVHTAKDGRHFVAYWVSGKQEREYFGRGREALLAAQERDIEIKKEKRRRPQFKFHPDDILFEDLARQYLFARTVDLSPKTGGEIYNTLRLYALPVFGQKYVRYITIDDWHQIQQAMTERGITNRSINKYFQYLHKTIQWGIDNIDALSSMTHPWIRRTPLRILKKYKVNLPDIEDLRRIIKHAPEHLAWAIEVEYHTGVRPGRTELFNMKWDDIDFETGAIRIYASKTDRYHTQYVSKAFLDRLRKKRAWFRAEAERLAKRRGKIMPECPYVISYQGERITSQVAKSWNEAKRAARIDKPIRLYDLRHFYITYALLNGANILELAKRVGHKGPEMIVRIYSHLVDDLKAKEPLPIPPLFVDSPVDNSDLLTNRIDQTEKGANG